MSWNDMRKSKQVSLELGLLCDPISSQLRGLVLKVDAERLGMDNRALNRLVARGYLGPSATEALRKKLLRECRAAVRRFEETQNPILA